MKKTGINHSITRKLFIDLRLPKERGNKTASVTIQNCLNLSKKKKIIEQINVSTAAIIYLL